MAADGHEIEITYSVLVDGVEVGFGTSGASASVDEAADFINTAITRGDWEQAAEGATPGGSVS